MGAQIIVSYDGTPNDDDALALGKALAAGGSTLALAYVRHSREFDPRREELAQHDAERRLSQGAALLAEGEVATHVVLSPSTGAGLEQLAQAEGASLIVFGSDYRTPPGRAEPGNTAQHLLEGGAVAIAVAAAGLRTAFPAAAIKAIGLPGAEVDPSARQAADALAAKLGAEVVSVDGEPLDLVVVGSQAGAPSGRIALGGTARAQLNAARGSVLVLPRDATLAL